LRVAQSLTFGAMRHAIDFDDELSIKRHEVHYIAVDRMLPTKFPARETAITQAAPKPRFGACLQVAQLASSLLETLHPPHPAAARPTSPPRGEVDANRTTLPFPPMIARNQNHLSPTGRGGRRCGFNRQRTRKTPGGFRRGLVCLDRLQAVSVFTRSRKDGAVDAEGERESVLILDFVEGAAARTRRVI